jgi:hypothetical protein
VVVVATLLINKMTFRCLECMNICNIGSWSSAIACSKTKLKLLVAFVACTLLNAFVGDDFWNLLW